jgi:hypothetical protein
LKGIIGATDSYASSSSTNAKWAATVRPQPSDHDTSLTTQQQQLQQHTNGDTAADSSTANSGAVVTFSETTTPEQRQRRQLSVSLDVDSDIVVSSGTAAAGADVASPDENSEQDCSDAAVDTSDEQQCDAEVEQQAREFDCYVNSRLVPLTGKKGRGSVMFSSSYSAVQNAAVQAAAVLLGLSYSDTDNGAKVSAAANASDSTSSDANGSSSSSQQQRGSKQKRRDAWGTSDAANDTNSSTANGSSNSYNSSDSTAAGSGSSGAVTTVNAPFLQNIEVVADARSLKKLEQLAGLLPRERGGAKRVICLRYQKGVCNRRPLDCEWAHFQGNLQKIGRFKPLLDLVHMVEGSKKGSAKARRPRSDSFGEAASAAAAVLAGNSSSSGNQSSDVSGNAALQSGADGSGSSGSRSRGGSVGSATEASMPSLVFSSLQVSLRSVMFVYVVSFSSLVTFVAYAMLQRALWLLKLFSDATTKAYPVSIQHRTASAYSATQRRWN